MNLCTSHFHLRKLSKSFLVYMYIHYGAGKPYRYNTGIRVVNEKHWSYPEKKMKQKVTGGDEINKKLERIREEFKKNIYGKKLTIENIKAALNIEIEEVKKATFFEEWDSWIKAKGKENTPRTATHRKVTKGKLEQYEKILRKPITREQITFGFLQDFANFLHEQNYAANTVSTHIKRIKTFMAYLEATENPKISDFKIKKAKTVKIYLLQEELKQLWDFKFNVSDLYIARDLYVLRCDTGLRIGDFKRLGPQHIKNNAIEMQTNKAETITYVPLSARALKILEKYNYQLPAMPEQEQNKFIKLACKRAGITSKVEKVEVKGGDKHHIVYEKWQLITTHTAIKTFITHREEEGVPIATIAKMVGKDVKTIIDHYLGESSKRKIKEQMESAFANQDNSPFLKVS